MFKTKEILSSSFSLSIPMWDIHQNEKDPPYKVKVTQGHYEYTCEVSNVFHNQAIYSYHVHVTMNLEGMDSILVLLKEASDNITAINVDIHPS